GLCFALNPMCNPEWPSVPARPYPWTALSLHRVTACCFIDGDREHVAYGTQSLLTCCAETDVQSAVGVNDGHTIEVCNVDIMNATTPPYKLTSTYSLGLGTCLQADRRKLVASAAYGRVMVFDIRAKQSAAGPAMQYVESSHKPQLIGTLKYDDTKLIF